MERLLRLLGSDDEWSDYSTGLQPAARGVLCKPGALPQANLARAVGPQIESDVDGCADGDGDAVGEDVPPGEVAAEEENPGEGEAEGVYGGGAVELEDFDCGGDGGGEDGGGEDSVAPTHDDGVVMDGAPGVGLWVGARA